VTTVRMAKLDNALLDTTWTDARAAKLDNLDAAVSTRLAAADYTAPDNSNIAAIKAKTDNLNFSGTDVKATLDGEKVTVSSNEDKTGYKLASDGLDSVSTTAPTGVASNFREMSGGSSKRPRSRPRNSRPTLTTALRRSPRSRSLMTALRRLKRRHREAVRQG